MSKKDWKIFDVIENAGGNIHKALNQYNDGCKPPDINATRIAEDQLFSHYSSQRKLCPVVFVSSLRKRRKFLFRLS